MLQPISLARASSLMLQPMSFARASSLVFSRSRNTRCVQVFDALARFHHPIAGSRQQQRERKKLNNGWDAQHDIQLLVQSWSAKARTVAPWLP